MPYQQDVVFSGEQMIPGKTNSRIEEEHQARYKFAEQFVKDKVVLDIACGVGYGTKHLKDAQARHVFGVDISDQVINYAKTHYSTTGVEFQCLNATNLNFDRSCFDVIVSFETIEHLSDADRNAYLQELQRVLKPDGILLLSTPNRRVTSPGQTKPRNSHHVREYTLKELEAILLQYGFVVTDTFGQVIRHKLLHFKPIQKIVSLLKRIHILFSKQIDKKQNSAVVSFRRNYEPRYYVVIAQSRNIV